MEVSHSSLILIYINGILTCKMCWVFDSAVEQPYTVNPQHYARPGNHRIWEANQSLRCSSFLYTLKFHKSYLIPHGNILPLLFSSWDSEKKILLWTCTSKIVYPHIQTWLRIYAIKCLGVNCRCNSNMLWCNLLLKNTNWPKFDSFWIYCYRSSDTRTNPITFLPFI